MLWTTLQKRIEVANALETASENIEVKNDLELLLSLNVGLFGSRIMGIAHPKSDLDMYVERDTNKKDANINSANWGSEVYEAIKIIRNSKNWIFYATILDCRCPIVKVKHINTNIECDISFSHGMAYYQVDVVKYILDLQPIARYMIIFLREWLKGKPYKEWFYNIITSLVIFFLQKKKFIPSIEILQENLLPDIGPWVTHFNKVSLAQYNMLDIDVTSKNVQEMLKQFFTYYGCFDFAKYGISPYLGKEIFKIDIAERWINNNLTLIGPITIQDFTQLNTFLGSDIPMSTVISFQITCRNMHNHFLEAC